MYFLKSFMNFRALSFVNGMWCHVTLGVHFDFQGFKSFRFSLISDFFIKSNFKGARANLKTTF